MTTYNRSPPPLPLSHEFYQRYYTADQMRDYGDARAAHARKQALEDAAKIARDAWNPNVTIYTDDFKHAAILIEKAIKELK